MFKHYLMSSMRNAVRHKLFSIINIFGLAIGLTATVLIFLFVQDEVSYDKFWDNADNIYRVESTFHVPNREPMGFSTSPGPLKDSFKEYFSQEVEYISRMNRRNPNVKIGKEIYQDRIAIVDEDFTKIFSLETLAGDVNIASNLPGNVAISESLAKKYFGEQNPIGQTITMTIMGNEKNYNVSGVFKDMPSNSHMDLEGYTKIVASDYVDYPWLFDNWFSVNNYTYFTLKPNGSLSTIIEQSKAFTDASVPDDGGDKLASDILEFSYVPMLDIHLKSIRLGSMRPNGDINLVYAFSGIAILIVIIASINFMNLSTARATQRAREVALRKVLGSGRNKLIVQFIFESIFLTFMALILSLLFIELSLDWFNQLLGKEIALSFTDPTLLSLFTGLVLVVGGAGGIYPSFVISAFRPAEVLKANKSSDTGGSVTLRNILVVFQFSISIALIVATAVIFTQTQYFSKLDRGFNSNNLLVVDGLYRNGVKDVTATLKDEVLRLPNVKAATIVSEGPGSTNENNQMVTQPNSENSENMLMGRIDVDKDFTKTYQIPIIAGRDYDESRATDKQPSGRDAKEGDILTSSIIINETAVRKLGYANPQSALGKIIRRQISGGPDGKLTIPVDMSIIGVIPDVHFNSLKQVVRPEMYPMGRTLENTLSVSINGDINQTMEQIKKLWGEITTDEPFNYYIANEKLAQDYKKELNQAKMFAIFSILAVLIGCLGLFGLSSFVATQRTKEIGIRKVLGANSFNIVKLLVWQFSKPVFISALIACPIIFYAMVQWLQKFPYRIDSLWIIPIALFASFIALSIAWLTVGAHAFKVSKTKPITALRYE